MNKTKHKVGEELLAATPYLPTAYKRPFKKRDLVIQDNFYNYK